MKVSEIRDITKKLDKSVIVELLVKTYRHVPKEKKRKNGLNDSIRESEGNNKKIRRD